MRIEGGVEFVEEEKDLDVDINELPRCFGKRTIWLVLAEPYKIETLYSTFQPRFHDQLRQILLDGLCKGIFMLESGDCRTGLWKRNETCTEEVLTKYMKCENNLLFSRRQCRSIFGCKNPNKVEKSTEKATQIVRTSNAEWRTLSDIGALYEGSGAGKVNKSIMVGKKKPKKARVDLKNIKPKNLKYKKRGKEWNDEIALSFRRELGRLKAARRESGLDGVDRGALK